VETDKTRKHSQDCDDERLIVYNQCETSKNLLHLHFWLIFQFPKRNRMNKLLSEDLRGLFQTI